MNGSNIRESRTQKKFLPFSSSLPLLLMVILAMAFDARAADPLDEVDGTEGWDQVVAPVESKPMNRPTTQEILRKEIAQWESIKTTWETVRKQFMHEKAEQKRMSLSMRQIPTGSSSPTDDGSDDWDDAPGEQWLVPSGAVDKAIDSEINESTEKRSQTPAASAPAPIVPPPMKDQETIPSAFKQEQSKDLGGGLAPGPADMTSPVPPPPPAAEQTRKKDDADAGAEAAAEMLRRQQEEKRRKQAELKARKQAEAEAGAAAAARLLRLQQERKRKEQEELRKKEGVKVDEEGQVIDPELQQEMNEDEPDSE